MNHLPTILTTAAILASAASARVKADLVVDSWSLLTLVNDFTPPASESDASYFKDAQTPFSASHTASLPAGSYSTASYDIGWLLDDAHFDITTSHHLAQLDGQTGTSGRIYLTPSVDSLVTFSGNWQYAWPGSVIGATTFGAGVYDYETQEELVTFVGQGGNVGLDPPFGAFNLSASTNLTAGREYLLIYRAQVFHFDPTPPGTFGEGSGEFHFTITPIPEPASALLLALPILAKRSRRRRSVGSRRCGLH
ncbi:MAG: hypothetical protein HS101_04735 [Planctomycetia bacterium]|nr:hypothetical protein [Planctomycetia bacterium]MCC7314260.1 hypothetical protein [Planctomycetota bacterium]